MERDPNIFPEIKILRCPPPMEGIARAIAKVRGIKPEVEVIPNEPIRQPDGGTEPRV